MRVTATDSHGASIFDVFELSVANANDVPLVANPIADQSVTEDQAFSFTVPANSFADVDVGDTLTYTATRADGLGAARGVAHLHCGHAHLLWAHPPTRMWARRASG